MDPTEDREPRSMWAFWIACGLLVIGGVTPLLFGAGGTNRIGAVIIPFGIAAAAMGANALLYHQGRALSAGLYFVAGISAVYGIMSMLAVPLRLAVVGTCPNGVATCPAGFEQPLTVGENTGLTVALALGLTAILVGFLGLLMYYRSLGTRRRTPSTARVWPDSPPTPAATVPAKPKPEPVLVGAAVATRHEAEAAPAAPRELPELEAPPELLELPAPHDETEPAAVEAAPVVKPRVRRARKPRPPIIPEDTPPAAS